MTPPHHPERREIVALSSTRSSSAIPPTADIAASALASSSVKARSRHQIHQHIGVTAIDGDLVAVNIGRPVAGQEQDASAMSCGMPMTATSRYGSSTGLSARSGQE